MRCGPVLTDRGLQSILSSFLLKVLYMMSCQPFNRNAFLPGGDMDENVTLQKLREQQEWTQEQLAEIAGVDVQIVKDIEAGTPVSWTIAMRITVKVKNYLGGKAIEGLNIPQNRG